jgi:hypothetical protein
MFDSPILNVFLTLSFTYFLLSLIVSSIREIISSWGKARGKMLEEALETWIHGDGWKKLWKEHLSVSPFITSLQNKAKGKFPSYVPASNFVQALLSRFRRGNEPLTVESIRQALMLSDAERQKVENAITKAGQDAAALQAELTGIIGPEAMKKLNELTGNSITPDSVKTVLGKLVSVGDETRTYLLAMLDKAENKLENLEKDLEKGFDTSMERLTGWYKRRSRTIVFWIGFAVTVALNIDTVQIARELWMKPEVAKQVADRVAEMYPKIKRDSLDHFTLNVADDSSVTKYVVRTKHLILPGDSTGSTALDTIVTITEQEAVRIGQAHNSLETIGIPMGWKKGLHPPFEFPGDAFGWLQWLLKIIGLFLTAICISLGAPFWFELAGKIVNLRGSGAKPASATDKPKKN